MKSLGNIPYAASEVPIYDNINVMVGTQANKQFKIVESSQEQGYGAKICSSASSSSSSY